MDLWKYSFLFYLGGGAYMILEFLWRGRSHYSMFLLGGICFLMLGQLQKTPLPLAIRTVLGAAGITVLELATGLLVNRDHTVWDYRHMPLQFAGQVCLPYSLLWIPVSFVGMLLYRLAEGYLERSGI
jgi:uncharacterized membrane protein